MPGTDLGNDTGTATINATSKVVELFLALLEKIYEQTLDPEHRMKRAEFKEYKDEKARRDMSRKLDTKGGEVALRYLKKSGEPLTTFNLNGLDKDKDVDRFKQLCKREGIVFSGTYVDREDGKLDYQIVVRAKDLDRIKAITERMNDEKRIEAINERITEIWKKPEVTEQDLANIRELQRQKAEIQGKSCVELNRQQAETIFDNAVNNHGIKCVDISEALDRNTGRSLDRDVYTIVADSHDPSKYIRCHGYTDTYKDKEYIKTEYEVFNGGKKVLTTHDGRFDGRPKDYWDTQKAAIIEAGGFTGAVFKFYNEAEYQRWAEYATRENTEELSLLKPGAESRTAEQYDRAVEALKQQLADHGVEIDEQKGTLVRTVSDMDEQGKPIPGTERKEPLPSVLSKDLTPEQKSDISECYTIKNQIDNFTQMKAAEAALTQAKAYEMVIDSNTPEEQKQAIHEQVITAQERLDNLKDKEKDLYQRRMEINAVQADQSVTVDREKGLFTEWDNYEPEQEQTEKAKTAEQEQESEQPEQDGQHPDDMGREEIVEGDEDKRKTLEEWEAVVQDDKKRGAEEKTPEAEKGMSQTGKTKNTHDRE